MIEGKTRKVYIPDEEHNKFIDISLIISGSEELTVRSILDVCDLYRVADKYDIQLVIETCRQLIKSFLRTRDNQKVLEHADDSIPVILDLTEEYRDDDLKDAVKICMESKKNFETNDYALGKHLKETLFTEWNCEIDEINGFFKMSRIVQIQLEFYQ